MTRDIYKLEGSMLDVLFNFIADGQPVPKVVGDKALKQWRHYLQAEGEVSLEAAFFGADESASFAARKAQGAAQRKQLASRERLGRAARIVGRHATPQSTAAHGRRRVVLSADSPARRRACPPPLAHMGRAQRAPARPVHFWDRRGGGRGLWGLRSRTDQPHPHQR